VGLKYADLGRLELGNPAQKKEMQGGDK